MMTILVISYLLIIKKKIQTIMKNIADIKILCLISVTFQKYTVTKFITEDIKNYVVKKREVQTDYRKLPSMTT